MDSEMSDVLDDAAQAGPDGYETAADAELGQVLAESVARTGPLDPDAVHSYSASTITSQGTITADVAEVRAETAREFRDTGEPAIVAEWTNYDLAQEIGKNRPDTDARVLRVLAARIASNTRNEDPLLTLTDIAMTLTSLNAAAAALAGPHLSDEDGPEMYGIYAETIDHLRKAAEGVVEMAGWI